MPKIKDGEVVGYMLMSDGKIISKDLKPTYSQVNRIRKRVAGALKGLEIVVVKKTAR